MIEQQIGRLDIAVHDAELMRVIERLCHAQRKLGGVAEEGVLLA